MTYKVLARKWRPQRFEQVIGQNHVTRSLQNAILRQKIGQAYVLAGTRGVGKTSVARIFAKAIRCQNQQADGNACNNCDCCLDFDSGSSMNVIEIDGASNNGVDNIRELIEDVHYLPTLGKYKVYIIDEVHMVTNQAFNALLKTLEEPPAHVVFIFATTEPQKLLGTVLSRCQRFDFRHVDVEVLQKHLLKIAEHEGILVENVKFAHQICQQGKGSVRDTFSLLDQVLTYCADNRITEESLVASLGLARLSAIKEIAMAILGGDFCHTAELYRLLISENVESKNILLSILDYFYELIDNIDNLESLYQDHQADKEILESISAQELFWIYETLARDSEWVLSSIDPIKVADVMLQKLALRRTFISDEGSLQGQIPQNKKKKVVEKKGLEVAKQVKSWDQFLEYLNSFSPAMVANLEQGNILSDPAVSANSLTIRFGFDDSGSIFMDYMQEKGTLEKLKQHLRNFFEVSDVDVQFIAVDSERKSESNFRSRAEIESEKEEVFIEQKKKEFLGQPIIKEAEKLFGSRVDKIILNNPKKS